MAARLRATPELITLGVEELLRYDPPSVTVGRAAMEDLEMGGAGVRAGEQVVPLLGATNRDPAQFADPDRLDLSRGAGGHVAFGAGPHHCPGAPPRPARGLDRP